jgi:radical SAM-linked protein
MLRGRFCLKLSERLPFYELLRNGEPNELALGVRGEKEKGDRHIVVSSETILVLIEFKVRGNLRFLSHAEMAKVFQRACVRAGIKVLHSKGFNPRLKLSLPLPRSVGIEVDDDLLCLRISAQECKSISDLCASVKDRLSERLPDGLELLTARSAKTKASIQPCLAVYVLTVREEYMNEKLKGRIGRLLASENLNLQRRMGPEGSRFKNVDVRPFLKSIELDKTGITVECKIVEAGSIRIDEILELLELDYGMLSAPIRRSRVQWQVGELPFAVGKMQNHSKLG